MTIIFDVVILSTFFTIVIHRTILLLTVKPVEQPNHEIIENTEIENTEIIENIEIIENEEIIENNEIEKEIIENNKIEKEIIENDNIKQEINEILDNIINNLDIEKDISIIKIDSKKSRMKKIYTYAKQRIKKKRKVA